MLQKKVSELEQKQRAAESKPPVAADDVVTAGATKGSFKLPGSNTSVTLGGYVKLDAVFSNPSAGANSTADLFLQPNAIPVGHARARTSITSSSSALANRGYS